MNVVLAAGIATTGLGVVGYLAGLVAAYEGRAFSLTAVMIGITLVAVGSGGRSAADVDGETP